MSAGGKARGATGILRRTQAITNGEGWMDGTGHPDDVQLLRVAGEGAEEAELPVLAHVAQCGRCATIVRYVRFAAEALRRSAPGLGEEGRGEVLGRVMRTVGEVVPYEGGGGMSGSGRV